MYILFQAICLSSQLGAWEPKKNENGGAFSVENFSHFKKNKRALMTSLINDMF